MKLVYNVEIQMSGTHTTTNHMVEQIAIDLGTDAKAIDEMEMYSATLFFESELQPSEIRERIRVIMAMYNMTFHYIDVVYRYDTEINADRFVVFSDGAEKEYTGRMTYEEDK